jgi:hypothetical protein
MTSKFGLLTVCAVVVLAGIAGWFYFHPRLYAPSAVAPAASATPAPAASAPAPPDLITLASAAISSCVLGTPPPVPDATKATRAQMQAADNAFKAYDATTTAYTQCVDAKVTDISSKYKGAASDADIQDLTKFATRAHNTAVDQEQAQADLLNAQIRLYKSKHPHD